MAGAKLVPSLKSIQIVETTSRPPSVIVHAVGTVPTTGWTGATLTKRINVVQPADGIVDFDFYITPPGGIVADIVIQVPAESAPFRKESWMKWARVNSENGSKKKRL